MQKNYQLITEEIVNQITKEEEKLHNITIEAYTPTVIEYIKQQKENGLMSAIMDCLDTSGLSNNKEIYIFKRNYIRNRWQYFADDLTKDKEKIQEIIVANITYHEIRHILQYQKPKLFTEEEQFCIKHLSDSNVINYLNREYHDSLYTEIDAELYAAEKCSLMYKEDKTIREYFDKMVVYYKYLKNIYDFDKYLTIYINNNKQISNTNNPHIQMLFEQDGTFKLLDEIIKDKHYILNDSLATKIIGSEAFMNRLNNEMLNSVEKEFIIDIIEKYIELIEKQKVYNKSLFLDKKIKEGYYFYAEEMFNHQIESKLKYKEYSKKGSFIRIKKVKRYSKI